MVTCLIEINACNNFRDNLVVVVLKLEGSGYTKETIHIEYEWVPPCCSACLIYGHLLNDCPKVAPKRVVNGMNKGKGPSVELITRVLLKCKRITPVARMEVIKTLTRFL